MNAISIIQTFIGFGIAFVLLPWLILPTPKSARNTLDVLVINFIRWLAIVIVVTHVLVVFHLYETTALAILALIAVYFFKLRPKGIDKGWFADLGDRASVRLANFGDRFERGEVQVARPGSLRRSRAQDDGDDEAPEPRKRESIPNILVMFILMIPLLIVLGVAFYLRVKTPAAHVSLSPSDNYTIMTWTKLLEQNIIFPDGIYPEGIHAMLALWHKFSLGLDMSELVRFAGPVVAMLIPVGTLYAVLRLTRNPGAAVFAAAVFGIFGARPEFIVPFYRASAALPQELSLSIALLTLTFVGMAVTTREKGHLWTVGAGTLAMAMIHALPLFFFLALGGVLAVVAGAIAKNGMGSAIKVIAVMAGAALIGHLYIPIGMLFGKELFGGLNDAFGGDSSRILVDEQDVAVYIGQNALSIGALIGALFGFFGGAILLATKRRTTGATMIGLSAVAVVLFLMFDTSQFGLDPFFAVRLAWIVGPALALGYGVGLAGILAVIPTRLGIGRAAVSMVLAVLAILVFGARFPAPAYSHREPTDFESMSRQTQKIQNSSENFTYTIVGIPEQRQRILGQGFFVELWVFARDVRPQDAARPGYELPIPTQDVYITIEKEPFDALPLPPSTPTDEYYHDPVKRGRIMAIAYQWAETYRQYHDDMTVYYDDQDIRIYRIHRTADFRLADESEQFKDYEWHPNRLFNSGPTIQELNP